MNLSHKPKFIRPLTCYSVSIFLVASLLSIFIFFDEMVILSYSIFVISVLSLLVIWRFGIHFPYIGIVSMERLVQFHLLLTVPFFDVVIINMCASFILPFTDKSYRLDSYKVALIRGMNNSAMNIFMMLSAGYLLYYYIDLPLTTIDIKIILVIFLIAMVIQVINIGMLAVYHSIDNKDVKKLLNPTLVLADLIFVPTGVLSALLYQNSDKSLFWLFVFFLVVILLSFNLLHSSKQASHFKFNGKDYKSDLLDINSVCLAIMHRINHLFKYDNIYLGSFNNDLQVLELYIKHLKNKHDLISESNLIEISQINKLSNKVIEVTLKPGQTNKFAVLSLPFINQDGVFAFICIVKKSSVVFSVSDVNLFELLVRRYVIELSYAVNYKNLSEYKNTLELRVTQRTNALKEVNDEKTRLVKELQSMAQRDGLTGLYNRRYFDNAMKTFMNKRPVSLSLAIIDIDFFKKVNDKYGHKCGDEVLQQLANIFNMNHKHGMKTARYGGEEFVLLMGNIKPQKAIDYCQNLLLEISNYNFDHIAKDLKITISIGLIHYPEAEINDMFHKADDYLYIAKNSGRNQLQPQIKVLEND